MKGLATRLLLLVLLAVLPVLAFEIYTEHDARQVREQLMEEEALRLVRLVASGQQRIVDGAEQVLDTLASAPAVRDNRTEGCQPLLAELLRRQPRYANAFVTGVDGHLVCTPEAPDPSISLSDRDYFRAALSSGEFAVGTYTVGRYIKRQAIALAKPYTNRDGVVAGVVGVSLDLDWLGQQLRRLPLPPDATVSVSDRNGIVLAHVPHPPDYVGGPILETIRFILEGSEVRVVQATGRDGNPRMLAYSPPAVEPKGLTIAVGLNRNVTFAAFAQANRTGLALIVAGLVLALLIAALLSQHLIRRPVQRLLTAAERWKGGDLSARSGLADSSEFGRLGAAFDAMAAALADRERALNMALESTTDSVVVLDDNWRFSFLNGRARAILSHQSDPLGRSIWEVLPYLADHPMGVALRTAMEQRVPAHGSGTSPTLGRELEAYAYPSVDGLTVFFRDVTEERRISAALLQSEQLFRATFEQAAVGMAQVGMDGKFLRVNDRLCGILDRTREDLTAHTFLDITHPDDRAGDLELQGALRAGQASSISREKRYLRHDGSPVWVNLTAALLRDAAGRPDCIISVVEDISVRKRIETALQESEMLLRAVLEQLPAAVTILKAPDGKVALRSRFDEIILGPLTDQSSRGTPSPTGRVCEHADGRPYELEEYPSWRALHRGETVMAETLLHRRPGGGQIELEVYSAPIRNAGGAIVAAVVAGFDTTERNQARRMLARSNADLEARVREEVAAREAAQDRAAQAERMQALGLLAGGIAHDFNNVLQAIEGGAALIERRPGNQAAVLRLARLVREATSRGASVTRRLLAFGHRGDLRAETVDVAALLGGMREILTHTLGAPIAVEIRLADGTPPVLADKGQLETALVNLATNARDAMPKGGRLSIAAQAETVVRDGAPHRCGLAPGRYVRLTLTDTGAGMNAGTLARASEPFFTTKPAGAGTGLGLPMARGFAEQSGGALDITSAPGKGTTVTLWLPAAEAAARAAAAPPAAGTGPVERGAGATTRVLLVDDEEQLREVLAEQLHDAGYSMLVAASGEEALALLDAGEALDALVTDLSMPGMDGLAVIRAVQKARPGLPAVLLTGYAGDDAAVPLGAAVSGSFTLLRKPIRLHELTDRLQALLAARQGAPT